MLHTLKGDMHCQLPNVSTRACPLVMKPAAMLCWSLAHSSALCTVRALWTSTLCSKTLQRVMMRSMQGSGQGCCHHLTHHLKCTKKLIVDFFSYAIGSQCTQAADEGPSSPAA